MHFYSKNHFQLIFLKPKTKIMELEHLKDVHLGSFFFFLQCIYVVKVISNVFLL